MTSLDIFFGDALAQVDELVADAKAIVDKRFYQKLYREDARMFSAVEKHITIDEYWDRNEFGVIIEEFLEKKYGKSLVQSWRDEIKFVN